MSDEFIPAKTYIHIDISNYFIKMALNLKPSPFATLALFYLVLFIMLTNQTQGENPSKFKVEDTNHVFYRYNDMKPGLKLPIYFGGAFSTKIPKFLPREKSQLIPFSSEKLPLILNYFGFKPDSPQAKAMKYTLHMCELRVHGQHKRCVTSFETMIEYVLETFGPNFDEKSIRVLSTSPLPKGTKLLQNYTVLEVRPVLSPKMNACHMMVYPYAVFHCHYPEMENRVFEILVKGEDDRVLVNAIANCHMNSSSFDPDLVAFRILGFTPGSAPLCHFLPSDDLVWVPTNYGSM